MISTVALLALIATRQDIDVAWAAWRNGDIDKAHEIVHEIEESQGQPLHQSLSSILERAQECSCDTKVEDDISLMAVEMGG